MACFFPHTNKPAYCVSLILCYLTSSILSSKWAHQWWQKETAFPSLQELFFTKTKTTSDPQKAFDRYNHFVKWMHYCYKFNRNVSAQANSKNTDEISGFVKHRNKCVPKIRLISLWLYLVPSRSFTDPQARSYTTVNINIKSLIFFAWKPVGKDDHSIGPYFLIAAIFLAF